jgi:thioredoxin 2
MQSPWRGARKVDHGGYGAADPARLERPGLNGVRSHPTVAHPTESDPAMTEPKHIVCPACGAINRIPGHRSPAEAHCGTCKAGLFVGAPVAVDAAGFDRHSTRNDVDVLIDVWAPWCGPCRTMAPEFERAARMLEPDVRLLKLNADENPEISARYDIRGIPALLLFRNGRLRARTAGAMDANRIAAWARSQP